MTFPSVPWSLLLSRWPGHLPAAHQVQMEMLDSLAAVFAGVHHNAVALRETFLPGNFPRHAHQVPQQSAFVCARLSERSDVLARNDQDMYRRFGTDISECVRQLILIHSG